ncbi:high-affinity branched-chain amino acid ABC transporter membrane protein [Klebsiella pneumoniae]|uniref:hypothetical protein n=1 Tax=Klebsiella pneumoniae complex TaxID=3390273 RepID=UPI0003BE7DA5|nr:MULTISPECIES: hypothetical protein [Klebsiella]ESN31866.1 hypothetical protein L365_04650 [Klebsiella pneumoniae MGH 19]MDG5794005.1 hypothetical protein [Klebsiella pneumoniae]MDR8426901.1 hypothetical protein [Klebsiella pneumoniae]MEA4355942.1 hypothetical protein [Klebsiella pneumoniae]SQC46252.1 high-affinity branched-chain amino acid ABC transporter membrane protein [Klebsiella pneumoniae]
MKQLTVFEMEEISGGTLDLPGAATAIAETIGAAILGGTMCALMGTILGGRYAGSNGGLLGFGLLGNAVGFIWGVLAGSVGGAIMGALSGWDQTFAWVNDAIEGLINGTLNTWS